MRVFVTGASGFIGRALIRELIEHGHQVVGLARSDKAAAAIQAVGAEPHRGELRDLDSLRAGAKAADGVVHLAFTFSFAELPMGRLLNIFFGGAPAAIPKRAVSTFMETDRRAIDALGAALEGSGRPLVTTFGTMGLASAQEPASRPATELDAINPSSPGYARALNEHAVEGWASRGVRATIVRLAPSVHGDEDTGLVPQLIGTARKKGQAIYVGSGQNRWSGVHRQDAASLFRLALEKGSAGAHYHGVGEEGVPFKAIAEVIGRRIGVPVKSMTLAEAKRQLGWFGPFVVVDNPASSRLTQEQLGWTPTGPTLLKDLDREAYFDA